MTQHDGGIEVPVISTLHFLRVCPVPIPQSPSVFGGIAVSGSSAPHPVLICDVDEKRVISVCSGHAMDTWGLACVSSDALQSNPLIVSGDDRRLLVFDAMEGKQICSLPDPPRQTVRILHVPEWENEVFVGCALAILHYDVGKERKLGGFEGRHRSNVWGLSASASRNLLFSACPDKTVRIWSKNGYQCQGSFNVAASAYSCYHCDDTNLLLVGLHSGVIEVWDSRKTDQRIKSLQFRPGPVLDIARIDNRFVSVGDNSTKVWNPNRESGEEILHEARLRGAGRGVCVLSHASHMSASISEDREELQDRVEVILKTDRLDLKIVTSSASEEILTSAALLSSSPFVRKNERNQEINISLATDIDSVSLLMVLLGCSPPDEKLLSFYVFFQELGLRKHSLLVCKQLRGISDLALIASFAKECWKDVEIADLEFANLSPFQRAILRKLKETAKKIQQSDLLRELPHSLMFAMLSTTMALEKDDTLSEVKNESFRSIYQQKREKLFQAREHSNVTLLTSDGGEERCHVEILVRESNCFHRMLHFEGKEFTSLKENGVIEIEDSTVDSHTELAALLDWIYTKKITFDEDIALLLRLTEHGDMYDDKRLIRAVCQQLTSLFESKDNGEVMTMLMEYGWRMANLPEDVQSAFMGTFSRKIGSQLSSVFDAILDFSTRNHSSFCEVLDRNEELERKVKELEDKMDSGDE